MADEMPPGRLKFSNFLSSRLILAGVLFALAVGLAGCAARSKAERAERAAAKTRVTGLWLVSEYADYQTDDVDLKIEDRVHTVSIPALRTYAAVAEELSAQIESLPTIVEDHPSIHRAPVFFVIEGATPNAFATYRQGLPMVAVNLSMVELLGDDAGMWAALIGHELAHFQLQHQARRHQRQAPTDAGKGALAVALAAVGIPFALLATDTALTAVERSYSREEELDADAWAVRLMEKAGYKTAGALRFQEKMAGNSASIKNRRGIQFFSTHPTWDERTEQLRQLITPAQR